MAGGIKVIDFQLAQAELKRELDKIRGGKFVTVGIHDDAGQHEGGISNAQLGAVLNYGNERIPPRPWLVPGVRSATPDIIDTIADGVKSGLSQDQIMNQVGAIAAGGVQQYMTDLKEPPNSPYTIQQKGSDNPLIDTGALRASVTWKVTSDKPTEGI